MPRRIEKFSQALRQSIFFSLTIKHGHTSNCQTLAHLQPSNMDTPPTMDAQWLPVYVQIADKIKICLKQLGIKCLERCRQSTVGLWYFIAGSVQYSWMHHFGKSNFFFLKLWHGRLFCIFSWLVYTQKINNFLKLKKQNVVCADEFSWFARKVVYTTYVILGISALILGSIFGEKYFFTNLKWQNFLHFFIKNHIKRMNNFWKIKETKCCMCK